MILWDMSDYYESVQRERLRQQHKAIEDEEGKGGAAQKSKYTTSWWLGQGDREVFQAMLF